MARISGIPMPFKVAVVAASIIVGGGVAHYYFSAQPTHNLISSYQAARDYNDVLNLFKQDWYWLSAREFNIDNINFVLNTSSPNEYEPRYFGKMQIKVLRDEKGAFVGFITYYLKNFREGTVLYLAVRPEFRGKRYAEKLLDQAVSDLKAQGASVVALVTWVNNKAGNKLYPRYGFKEVGREGNYVYYEKPIA
jgi:ribosomal protein S18 acetylase RimI-like enzyme